MRSIHIKGAALATALLLASGLDGALFDGVTQTPRRQMSILVHDERIVALQDGFVLPSDAEVIDLSNATVMPIIYRRANEAVALTDAAGSAE